MSIVLMTRTLLTPFCRAGSTLPTADNIAEAKAKLMNIDNPPIPVPVRVLTPIQSPSPHKRPRPVPTPLFKATPGKENALPL